MQPFLRFASPFPWPRSVGYRLDREEVTLGSSSDPASATFRSPTGRRLCRQGSDPMMGRIPFCSPVLFKGFSPLSPLRSHALEKVERETLALSLQTSVRGSHLLQSRSAPPSRKTVADPLMTLVEDDVPMCRAFHHSCASPRWAGESYEPLPSLTDSKTVILRAVFS